MILDGPGGSISMGRDILTISMVLWGIVVFGCGGGGEVARSGGYAITLKNEWAGTGEYRPRVTIPACGHAFYLNPDEVRVVECVPEEGTEAVLVHVEVQSHLPGRPPSVREIEVTDGQTVTIKQVDVTLYLEVR